MAKKQQEKKRKAPSAPKSAKLPRKLPDDPIARGVAIMREATGQKPKEKKPVRRKG